MPKFCALPPVDMATARVGRAYGMGWNRVCGALPPAQRAARGCRPDQLHAGMDFQVAEGTPILAVVAGRVSAIGRDEDRGRSSGLRGYGNCVVVETRGDIPGMPNPFWTLYAHMRTTPSVVVGEVVRSGKLLGYSGRTTNGQFAGMPPHLHLEFRRRNYPSSYDRDTINPATFWAGVGIDWTGSYMAESRQMGGALEIRTGGASDCAAGMPSVLSGLGDPSRTSNAYIAKTALSPIYAAKGETRVGPEVAFPPTYESETSPPDTSPRESSSGMVWLLGGAALVGLVMLAKGRR